MKKNKMYEFFVRIPYLARMPHPNIVSYMLGKMYKDELNNKKSVFASNKAYKESGERFKGLYAFKTSKPEVLDYCITLLQICEYVKYAKEDDKYKEKLSMFKSVADSEKEKYPEVAQYMTPTQAAAGLWQ